MEDEEHFLLHCPLYSNERETWVNSITDIFPDFVNLSNGDRFIFLMSYKDSELANLIGNAIHNCLLIRRNVLG